MENSSSIFKFVTIRNPSSEVNSRPNYEIQPETGFVKELIDILRGDKNQAEKILLMNQKLNAFIQSANFYKTKLEFTESVNKVWDKNKKH